MLWHLHPWGRRPCFSVLVVARKEVRPRSVAHHARASGMPGAWAATVCQSASAPWVPAPARLSRSTTRVISNLKSGFVVGSAFLAWLYYTQRHHSCISTRTHCGTCTPPASRSFKVCPTVCRTAWHAHKSPAARCIKLERPPARNEAASRCLRLTLKSARRNGWQRLPVPVVPLPAAEVASVAAHLPSPNFRLRPQQSRRGHCQCQRGAADDCCRRHFRLAAAWMVPVAAGGCQCQLACACGCGCGCRRSRLRVQARMSRGRQRPPATRGSPWMRKQRRQPVPG